MFGQSRLLLGLLCETDQAVVAQVTLWDRSNVWQAGWEQASKTKLATSAAAYFHETVGAPAKRIHEAISGLVPDWVRDRESEGGHRTHPLDGHVMKFSRLLHHAGLRLDTQPSTALIHDLSLQIERNAIQALSQVEERSFFDRLRGARKDGFTGSTTDDLVRHVILRTFDQLDQEFRSKSPSEQDEIARKISAALRDLPPKEQDRIRTAARLPDLTAETLRQTGRFASLGVGLSGMVGLAGFTAYTTLTSLVAAVTGLVGIHLSFGTYVMLTSGLAGITNPLVFIPMLARGTTWMASKANRSIRNVLYPTFVATSVMSFAASDEHNGHLDAFAARLGELIREIGTGSGPRTASLVARFPGLGRPAVAARLASHVTH